MFRRKLAGVFVCVDDFSNKPFLFSHDIILPQGMKASQHPRKDSKKSLL